MKLIELSQNGKGETKYAMVSDKDFSMLNKYKWSHAVHNEKQFNGVWRGKARSVVTRTENGKTIYMHKVILNPGKGMKVDHKDGNPLNNQRSNIRICTNAENLMNSGPKRSNTTGFKGVSKIGNKFTGNVMFNSINSYCGTHPTAKAAAIACDKKAYELCPKFAYLNFPNKINA